MGCLKFWGDRKGRSSGWKQAAKVNCITLTCMSVALLSCLISAITRSGGLNKALFFYDGNCDGGSVSQVNMTLHLLINVVSTLVVGLKQLLYASSKLPLERRSKYSAPQWFLDGNWDTVGPQCLSSLQVQDCVLALPVYQLNSYASSIQLHDVRDRLGADFHLTIATEEFLNGGDFYAPGGSLVQAGFSPSYRDNDEYSTFSSDRDPEGSIFYTKYGFAVNLTDYSNKNSDVMKNISTTVKNAEKWERLEISECKKEYIDCSGLKRYGNLVLVVNKPGGWIRDEIWPFIDDKTEIWNRYVPADRPNHLFYHAQCVMLASRDPESPTECANNCIGALGTEGNSTERAIYAELPDWQYDFFGVVDTYPFLKTSRFQLWSWDTQVGGVVTTGLELGAASLSVDYCLADNLDRVCHIGLSPTLLLAVTLCVVFKTCTAIVVTVVLGRRNQRPLVTLGDAMESFIENPDPVTNGMCTIGQTQMRNYMGSNDSFLLPGPRQWKALARRRWAVVPMSVWISSYFLFGIGIGVLAYFFSEVRRINGLVGTFYESEMNSFVDSPFSFTQGVMIANSPQLLLSFCYLAYNNLFTRLQMAREWSLFSTTYQPLRVTDPKGDQYSTYRLQLPYKYSLPLIATSIFLHWLLSNTIYLFISIGGYFGTTEFLNKIEADPSLPPTTVVALGYSVYSLLVMLVISCFLILLPAILSLKKLPSNIVIIGSNSLALSAACHVSSLSYTVTPHAKSFFTDAPTSSRLDLSPSSKSPMRSHTLLIGETYADQRSRNDSIEMQNLTPMLSTTNRGSSWQPMSSKKLLLERPEEDLSEAGDEQLRSRFTKLARSKIRWGVVKMPPEWHAEYDNEDATVGHLSFGVEEDKVTPPRPGRLYA